MLAKIKKTTSRAINCHRVCPGDIDWGTFTYAASIGAK